MREKRVYRVRSEVKKEGGWGGRAVASPNGYLRFLNSFMPSLSVTYWNPFSMSFASSSMLVETFVVYSSSLL